MTGRHLLAVAGCLVTAVACSSQSAHTAAPSRTPTPTVRPSPLPSPTGPTVWLCRPGTAPDPCASDLTATAVTASGAHVREAAPKPLDTGLDCFYVYPTVSHEQTANSDLVITDDQRTAAVAQAARFSSVCRVWAPMYRQRTVSDLANLAHDAPDSVPNRVALASVEAAWRDYLAHDNHGRAVVFIGHSQGASMLIRLLRADVDPVPALRAKTALALLIGGNVTVPDGKLVGGSFQHIPLCSHPGQHGCVIAYSSFPSEPPAFSFFGRAGSGVSLLSGETATDRQVACVNPAAVGSTARAPLHTYFPSRQLPGNAVHTPWTAYPGRFDAQCRQHGRSTWLQVTPAGSARDRRPKLVRTLGPAWGYHVVDVNLALGDLVADVAAVAR